MSENKKEKDSLNVWDEIAEELKVTYPKLSKYLKSKHSRLVKECFYKVFDGNDAEHILWNIRMNNDLTKELLKDVHHLFILKIKKIIKKEDVMINKNKPKVFSAPKVAPRTRIGLNRYILAWFVVLGFYVLTYILMIRPIPKDSNQVIFMLFGTIATGFGTVLGYFFGSSQSSHEKDEMIKETEKNAAQQK